MDNQDQLDRYILGQLNQQEAKDYRLLLANNADLAKEEKKRRSIISGIDALGNEQMRERIKAIRLKMKESEALPAVETKKGKIRIFRIVAAAAATVALILFSWQYISQPSSSPNQIFAQTYQPYDASLSTRDVNGAEHLIQADTYYKSKKYELAIPHLKTALNTQPTNSNLELALGNAYMASDQVGQAINHFQSIIDRKDALYSDQARWYLALCYLKMEKLPSCKKLLSILAQDANADFYQEAKELLKKL